MAKLTNGESIDELIDQIPSIVAATAAKCDDTETRDYFLRLAAALGVMRDRHADLRNRVAELEAELADASKDTARLDYCEGKDGRLDRILSCYFNSPHDTTYRDAIDTVADEEATWLT